MSAHNNVQLIGFIGQDRRLNKNRDTGDVTGLAFSIAVDARIPDPDKPGEWKDDTHWFWVNVSARNHSFEFYRKHLLKGAQIAMSGVLGQHTRKTEVRQDGNENVDVVRETIIDINATDIQILRFAKPKENRPEHGQQSAANQTVDEGNNREGQQEPPYSQEHVAETV